MWDKLGYLCCMAGSGTRRRKRQPGNIEELPSGALRVTVYAGIDPVTKRRHRLREIVPAGPKAAAEAEKVMRRLASQVDDQRQPRTSATVDQLLDRHFELVTLEENTLHTYVGYANKHIRPLIGGVKVGSLDAGLFDSFYAELRRCREHCDRSPYIEHRTGREHTCDDRCRPHVCSALGASTIRQIHFILSGALKRAVRWRWLATSPITQADPPAAPKPNPRPPSAAEAAQILAEAWKDPDWGTLIWLTMVTGARRGELCGIRWRHVNPDAGVLEVERSIGQRGGRTWEKDTKAHQQRRIALDPETIVLLTEHRRRCAARAAALDLELPEDAFVFSLAPDGSTHLLPDSVGQRYGKLAKRLGINSTIHKLRHYSATELITAGVDIRTVAGRLGHGGGGTTTLRVYTAWVSESDQRASTALFSRMPARPAPAAQAVAPTDVPRYPYEQVAAALREAIEAGVFPLGDLLPTVKDLGTTHGVSAGTAQRAVSLLKRWGYVEVSAGLGARVVANGLAPDLPGPAEPDPALGATVGGDAEQEAGRCLLNLEIRNLGQVLAKLTAEADPRSAEDLRRLLLGAIRRAGRDEAEIENYEMDVRYGDRLLSTFVV
jgi:integrase